LKYFLEVYQAWRWDETDEEAAESLKRLETACQAYEQRISFIADRLPPEVVAIADASHVDDAVVATLLFDRRSSNIQLVLRCGNIPDGYFDLVLSYEQAEMEPAHEHTLRRIAMETVGGMQTFHECYCHEIDFLPDARIEHRLIFHDADWFAIRCQGLSVQRQERPNRDIPPLSERVHEVSGDAPCP